jgi:ribonuclease HI
MTPTRVGCTPTRLRVKPLAFMESPDKPLVQIYTDGACSPNPGMGGWGAILVSPDHPDKQRELSGAEPDTTNNRMALRSAIAALELLGPRGGPLEITFVTDSNYVVLGMTRWVPAWRARGWRRKGGAIENLDLWQDLVATAGAYRVAWQWVRGHAGHAKNEYANDLATRAASAQRGSGGLASSGFLDWLATERTKGRYARYDPDADLRAG